jgi:large subunit ribosomal protein L31
MKKDIHPDYFEDAVINCACGSSYTIGSTMKEISVELCAKCHPFYTGKQKIIDTARRVEKFEKKLGLKAEKITGKKAKREKRAEQKKAKREEAEKAEA